MNAVRIYGSAGNQVTRPLGDNFVNLANSYYLYNS
jgi:hypothetical protein